MRWDAASIADVDRELLRERIAVIAPLLIMDEPTAALDARAEYAIFSSLRSRARDRTVLIITHRLASVRLADRGYVLAHGQVTESAPTPS